MPLFNVYVTERNLATYEVEARDAQEAAERYRSSGVQVSIENGADEVDVVTCVEAAPKH